jgi:hypothetical protein
MFDAIRKMADNAKQLTSEVLLEVAFNTSDLDSLIIHLNTEKQLFEGVNSLNIELSTIGGGYSPTTIRIKESKGQPTDKVTLKDTSDFYKSFEVSISQGDLIIEADTIKAGQDLQERWGDDLLGLTEASKDELIEFLIPILQEIIIEKLFE